MPVVVSVLIFIIYYIINNTGYKMARDGQWVVWMGMWTSTAVLAPLGAFLTCLLYTAGGSVSLHQVLVSLAVFLQLGKADFYLCYGGVVDRGCSLRGL